MKRIILLLYLVSISTFLISETRITLSSHKYKLLDLYNGIEIQNSSEKILKNEITDLNFEKINVGSLLVKNKYSLVIFGTAYGIGWGTDIRAREVVLKKLSEKYSGKIFEIVEYWNNDFMNEAVKKLEAKKMQSCSFEIVDKVPIYLDYGAKNISPLTSNLCKYFVHSAWIILDRKNHIHFDMEEMQTKNKRNYDKIYDIVSKYLSEK